MCVCRSSYRDGMAVNRIRDHVGWVAFAAAVHLSLLYRLPLPKRDTRQGAVHLRAQAASLYDTGGGVARLHHHEQQLWRFFFCSRSTWRKRTGVPCYLSGAFPFVVFSIHYSDACHTDEGNSGFRDSNGEGAATVHTERRNRCPTRHAGTRGEICKVEMKHIEQAMHAYTYTDLEVGGRAPSGRRMRNPPFMCTMMYARTALLQSPRSAVN